MEPPVVTSVQTNATEPRVIPILVPVFKAARQGSQGFHVKVTHCCKFGFNQVTIKKII